MIVSHAHRFIFMKTQKTAGSSVELFLRGFCGPDDIVTPMRKQEERAARDRPARNYLLDRGPLGLRALAARAGVWVAPRRGRDFHSHMRAAELRPMLGDDLWSGYLKFCVVRNPWDAHVSLFHWRLKHGADDLGFRRFCLEHSPDAKSEIAEIATIGGALAVDRVLRYETLEQDLGQVLAALGIDTPVALPQAKGTSRTDRTHYRTRYDEETRAHVARLYEREIALFGYSF